MALRQDEPWYPAAAAGFEAIVAGRARRADRIAVTPVAYSRWDAAAQAHQAAEATERNNRAARIFNSDGAFDPAATRAGLAQVDAPVLLLAGDLDLDPSPGRGRRIRRPVPERSTHRPARSQPLPVAGQPG